MRTLHRTVGVCRVARAPHTGVASCGAKRVGGPFGLSKLLRSRTSQSKQPRDHTARGGRGGARWAWSGVRSRRARQHARTRGRTEGRTDGWTDGWVEAGTHVHAHTHAYRRARRGSTLRRRRARVRGMAVCRRTECSGPRRPQWRWTRAYMSNARPVFGRLARGPND